MRITGYKRKDTEVEGLIEMESIAIVADAKKLKAIASFLNSAAEEMDKMGSDFDHAHLMDKWSEWDASFPDVQVVSTKYI
ncbi:hypothetical protein ABGI61_13930 [Rheinheimera sp. FR7-31]|uniref:Imm32 family immunity protein n=1 Tax=Rheinheimera fenheensis TaxID=3152295 RepID=UPI00325F74DE